MDLVFLNIRVGLFHNDHAITTANIAKAKQMLEEGGDWDRRNRLKVYEGLYAMSVRDFKLCADGLCEVCRVLRLDLSPCSGQVRPPQGCDQGQRDPGGASPDPRGQALP